MLVIVTAPPDGKLPKVVLTMAASEIDAILAGAVERFPVAVGDKTYDVEMIAASTPTPKTPKPNVRLRVANDALAASRAGTVTPLFPDPIPFVLVLMCSDPPPAKVRLGPNLVYERVDLRAGPAATPARPVRQDDELPLIQRLGLGLFFGGMVAVAGFFQGRDAMFYYVAGVGIAIWSAFAKTPRRGGPR